MRPCSLVGSAGTGYSTAPGGALAAARRGSIAVIPTAATIPVPARSPRRLRASAHMPSLQSQSSGAARLFACASVMDSPRRPSASSIARALRSEPSESAECMGWSPSLPCVEEYRLRWGPARRVIAPTLLGQRLGDWPALGDVARDEAREFVGDIFSLSMLLWTPAPAPAAKPAGAEV